MPLLLKLAEPEELAICFAPKADRNKVEMAVLLVLLSKKGLR
jgi:hypothetical protein